jgi:transcriptional regulator with XRE-family HTH domain
MPKRERQPTDAVVKDHPISEGLREAVEASGISKYALARGARISKPHFYRFLKGERDLSQKSLDRLASKLGVRIVLRRDESPSCSESGDSVTQPAINPQDESDAKPEVRTEDEPSPEELTTLTPQPATLMSPDGDNHSGLMAPPTVLSAHPEEAGDDELHMAMTGPGGIGDTGSAVGGQVEMGFPPTEKKERTQRAPKTTLGPHGGAPPAEESQAAEPHTASSPEAEVNTTRLAKQKIVKDSLRRKSQLDLNGDDGLPAQQDPKVSTTEQPHPARSPEPDVDSWKEKRKALRALKARKSILTDDDDLPDPNTLPAAPEPAAPEPEEEDPYNYSPDVPRITLGHRGYSPVADRGWQDKINAAVERYSIQNPGVLKLAQRFGGKNRIRSNERAKFAQFIAQLMTNNTHDQTIMADPELAERYTEIAERVKDPENMGHIGAHIITGKLFRAKENSSLFYRTLDGILQRLGVYNGVDLIGKKTEFKPSR